MDAPAGESWAEQGLRDIESRMLTDDDGDEAHEFVVVDSVVRSDPVKGARGSLVPSHSCVLECDWPLPRAGLTDSCADDRAARAMPNFAEWIEQAVQSAAGSIAASIVTLGIAVLRMLQLCLLQCLTQSSACVMRVPRARISCSSGARPSFKLACQSRTHTCVVSVRCEVCTDT